MLVSVRKYRPSRPNQLSAAFTFTRTEVALAIYTVYFLGKKVAETRLCLICVETEH